MTHGFMTAVADGLAERGVATLRFQFPYMEIGSRRPDRPALAHATVRAAMAAAVRLAPGLTLFAGGKSFGARMTSQAQAEAPLPNVSGLVFLGFPLHPANKPSDERAAHLAAVRVPMLFVQGTRDALAETRLLIPMVESLAAAATLKLLEQADHSFQVPVRSGRTAADVLDEALDCVVSWMGDILIAPAG
jgi:predicted alpha/beta-hydrolase family hydrolase